MDVRNREPRAADHRHQLLGIGSRPRQKDILCSLNAGAVRILLPPVYRPAINDMRAADEVILSRGPLLAMGVAEAVEILFDDCTAEPYVLHLNAASFDALPGEPPAGREWIITVWDQKKCRPHKCFLMPAALAAVPRNPLDAALEGKNMTSSIKGHLGEGRGKRRHSDDGVRALIARNQTAIPARSAGENQREGSGPAIGVSCCTVHRWLRSEDVPSEANRAAWSKWLEKHVFASRRVAGPFL